MQNCNLFFHIIESIPFLCNIITHIAIVHGIYWCGNRVGVFTLLIICNLACHAVNTYIIQVTKCYIRIRHIADWHRAPWRQLQDYRPLSRLMYSLLTFFFVHFTEWLLGYADQYRINYTKISNINTLGTVSIWICRPLINRFFLLSQTGILSNERFPTRNNLHMPLLLTTVIKTY